MRPVAMRAVATAHPNVALVKYWGKRPGGDNLPATPSLSITLGGLSTRTSVRVVATGTDEVDRDRVTLDGVPVRDPKIEACLSRLRARAPSATGRLDVASQNDFPTAAGLASSASGFAALVLAVDAALDLGLSAAERADEARRASASAARSLYGGFVALDGGDDVASWQPRTVLAADAWPLEVVVAVCSSNAKSVSSSDGMKASSTSPYWDRWLAQSIVDFAQAEAAVEARDFDALAAVAEANCLAMHAVMLSARPGLLYWNGATVECMHRVRTLRRDGLAVFFTIDAGPQVKAVCETAARPAVAAALADVPGVERIIVSGLGPGARLEPAT